MDKDHIRIASVEDLLNELSKIPQEQRKKMSVAFTDNWEDGTYDLKKS